MIKLINLPILIGRSCLVKSPVNHFLNPRFPGNRKLLIHTLPSPLKTALTTSQDHHSTNIKKSNSSVKYDLNLERGARAQRDVIESHASSAVVAASRGVARLVHSLAPATCATRQRFVF